MLQHSPRGPPLTACRPSRRVDRDDQSHAAHNILVIRDGGPTLTLPKRTSVCTEGQSGGARRRIFLSPLPYREAIRRARCESQAHLHHWCAENHLRNRFPDSTCVSLRPLAEWSFLTNHGGVLVCIAHDPEVRLRDIALSLGITERRVHGILADLTQDGYLVKSRDGMTSTDGRRIRYQIQDQLPRPESVSQDHAIGAVLDLLTSTSPRRRSTQRAGT